MLLLGIETSCDETGVALFHSERGLLGQKLYSQAALHANYGGVVPELASRDHIRRVLPLVTAVLRESGCRLEELDAIAYTRGPGLAGALLVGASIASALGFALDLPVLGIHHLEGHLLSSLLSPPAPAFPFVALLVSGGHTQLMSVMGVGRYELLGETLDDAAGEAFDKTAQLLGLGYPGGPAVSALAQTGDANRFTLPRPGLARADLNFSFSGLKTAVAALQAKNRNDPRARADIAAAFQEAIVDVLVQKSLAAVEATGITRLIVAGGVGANRQLRSRLMQEGARLGVSIYYPPPDLCTDNGAMIAFAAAMRLKYLPAAASTLDSSGFSVRPRWDLTDV
jgi:tRNA N6-adenosine threonylcarbamoyltransferase